MSSYDRVDRSRRRGVWSHWVPLVVTVTVATVGLAAWAWSQRKGEEEEDEHEHEPGLDYENADYGDNPPYGASSTDLRPPAGPPTQIGPDGGSGYVAPPPGGYPVDPAMAAGMGAASGASWGDRMSGALRRTPSPQQFLGNATRSVMAGVTATGAAVGKALASIREEDKTAYADHETWSEEADAKDERGAVAGQAKGGEKGKRRKTVAVVVSAEGLVDDLDDDGFHEHASILSHVPRHNDFSKIKLYILIYAPGLKEQATVDTTMQTPADEGKSPQMHPTTNSAYNAVYSQALALVEKDAMVMPFTTPESHTHMLRILKPDVVYLQESLAGDNGSYVTQLQTWMRQDITLVVGAESGSGGLADSESEVEHVETKPEKWWQRPDRVGRGRGVVVVDSMRVHDDWARRVQGQE